MILGSRCSRRGGLLVVLCLLVVALSSPTVAKPLPSVTTSTTPSITGTAQVGRTLAAAPGTWSPAGVTLTYRWLRGTTPKNLAPISGASSTTYVVQSVDVAKRLVVEVTGTKSGYSSTVKSSAMTEAVIAPSTLVAATPTINGTPQVGAELTAAAGLWSDGVELAYQWRVGTTAADSIPIPGATTVTYVPAAADIGKGVAVQVTGSKIGYTTASRTSVMSDPVLAAPSITAGAAVVSGEPRVGATLVAEAGAWSPDGVVLAYQWLRDGAETAGATEKTYELVPADLGAAISVRVTGTNAGLPTSSSTSVATPPITEGTQTRTPTPTITGTTEVADVLTAVAGGWDTGVVLSYQWLRDGTEISGETTPTHVVVAEDNHTTLAVTVTGDRDGYLRASRTSDGVAVVQGRETRAKIARALQTYRAALATADTEPVDVFVGPSDSIGEGYGATSVDKRWISVLRDDLRRSFQPSGVAGGFGYADLWNQGGFSDHPVRTTSPVQNWSYGLGDEALAFTTASQTATITETFTTMDLFYAGSTDGSTGILRYTVDGGPAVLVNTGNKAVGGGGQVERISGLSPGVHTVRIIGGASVAAPIVEGVMIYDGDTSKGIRLWEGARSGTTSAFYAGAYRGWEDSLRSIHPDLVVLPLGSNDYYVGRTAATTKTYLLAIISRMRAKFGSSPSIVLMPYYDRASSSTETWADYVDMYYSIAAADPDITVFDLTPLFGPWTGDNRSGLTSSTDLVHPSDAGQQLIGDALTTFLAP